MKNVQVDIYHNVLMILLLEQWGKEEETLKKDASSYDIFLICGQNGMFVESSSCRTE